MPVIRPESGLLLGVYSRPNCKIFHLRCCFCLTLRSGSLVIGIGNCLFYIACFLWYLTSNSFGAPISESLTFTNLDISVFVIFLVQLVVNLLLIVGAVRRLPSHIFPWICANAVFCGICMVSYHPHRPNKQVLHMYHQYLQTDICPTIYESCHILFSKRKTLGAHPNVLNSSQIGIVVTIFWGTTKLGLNHSDYVGVLTILGLITGINLFCVIVVFQVRRLCTKNISLKLGSFCF